MSRDKRHVLHLGAKISKGDHMSLATLHMGFEVLKDFIAPEEKRKNPRKIMERANEKAREYMSRYYEDEEDS